MTFPGGSQIPVESNGILTVALQDTSLADAPARTIATSVGKAIRFPMAFAIKYSSSQIVDGLQYSLRVRITNENNELLYINDVYTAVTPAGPSRSRCINVPVIQVKRERRRSLLISSDLSLSSRNNDACSKQATMA